jgi:transposase
MGQVTVFSGPERRRRWSEEERLQILSEAFAPGACVAEVCRRHDISSALIYTWRRKLLDAEGTRNGDVRQSAMAHHVHRHAPVGAWVLIIAPWYNLRGL